MGCIYRLSLSFNIEINAGYANLHCNSKTMKSVLCACQCVRESSSHVHCEGAKYVSSGESEVLRPEQVPVLTQ